MFDIVNLVRVFFYSFLTKLYVGNDRTSAGQRQEGNYVGRDCRQGDIYLRWYAGGECNWPGLMTLAGCFGRSLVERIDPNKVICWVEVWAMLGEAWALILTCAGLFEVLIRASMKDECLLGV